MNNVLCAELLTCSYKKRSFQQYSHCAC